MTDDAATGPGAGHNSGRTPKVTTDDIAESSAASGELKAFVERIQRLEEEKKAIADDVKDIFAEIKGRGFDAKVIRAILRDMKQDRAELQEFDALYDLYAGALDFMR